MVSNTCDQNCSNWRLISNYWVYNELSIFILPSNSPWRHVFLKHFLIFSYIFTMAAQNFGQGSNHRIWPSRLGQRDSARICWSKDGPAHVPNVWILTKYSTTHIIIDNMTIYDDIWWYMMIYDDIWWYMMIWWYLVIYDDIWWYMMLYDDIWWYLMIYHDIWSYILIYDGMWWYMMIYDDIWWFVMMYDDMMIYDDIWHIWWYMMIYDDIWWYMMIYDDIWWYMMICDDIWWYMMIYDDIYIWYIVYIWYIDNHGDANHLKRIQKGVNGMLRSRQMRTWALSCIIIVLKHMEK